MTIVSLPFPHLDGRPLAAALLACLLAVSCTSGTPDDDGGGVAAHNAVQAPLVPTTVDELPAIDGDGFAELRAQVRGTPLVVNFWASWCDPCEEEMPLLAAAARRDGDQIQFLGVDILDTRDPARTFLARYDVPYPSVFDPTGQVRDAVGGIGQPVTVFYDAGGQLVAKVDGQLSEASLEEQLARLRP